MNIDTSYSYPQKLYTNTPGSDESSSATAPAAPAAPAPFAFPSFINNDYLERVKKSQIILEK
jgi:hypothetical protein